jgi:threonine/homoserine/homoserine lactone efflux protein
MIERSRFWPVAAVLFTVINVGGAAYAAWMGEPTHAAVHVALIGATYLLWRGVGSSRRQEPQTAQLTDQRLEYIQQSVDAIALEVERIGEAQRFSDKLRGEQGENSPPKKDQ